jgi:hypothetical protein
MGKSNFTVLVVDTKSIRKRLKKTAKKVLVSAAVTTALIGFRYSICALADDYAAEEIGNYLKDYGWDLLGMEGENVYFRLREIDAGHSDPFRVIAFDIRHLKESFLVSYKGLCDNQLIYGLFGGAAWIVKGKALIFTILKFVK